MPAELVTAASILAGSGVSTWVADKLLGPSFDALGEQFRAYAGDRLSKILQRFESKLEPEQLTQLPPGFALQYFQKASFSEDDETLTEMWANLLVSASRGYHSHHANFADILSRLGPEEVRLLNDLVPRGETFAPCPPVNLKSSIREELAAEFKAIYYRSERTAEQMGKEAVDRSQLLYKKKLSWPGRITAVDYPYSCQDPHVYGKSSGGFNMDATYDVLAGQRLIDHFAFDLSQSFSSPYVEGVLVTSLGINFVQTCRG